MAHFVLNFVAMAIWLGQGQIQGKGGERKGESYCTTAEVKDK